MSLEIQITGNAGSGKTTAARIVAGALALVGFKVMVEDEDLGAANQALRVSSLKGTEVVIRTKRVQ